MPLEQRVVSRQKIGAGAAAPTQAATSRVEPAAPPRRRRTAVVVLVTVLVMVALGAGAWFLLGREEAPPPEPVDPTPVAGEVVQVEAVSINLDGGHYLRLGMAMQLTADAHGAPDVSRALDLAISLYSGRTVEEVADPATREALKAELAALLSEAYEGEVMDVYLTNYVTQ